VPQVGDCADDVKQAIANKIIALAKKTGERNPDVLCEQALKNIRSARNWSLSYRGLAQMHTR
jgi:hypothetical protein